MASLTTLSLHADDTIGRFHSLEVLPYELPPADSKMPVAFVALLAVNIFVVSGVLSFSLLCFAR